MRKTAGLRTKSTKTTKIQTINVISADKNVLAHASAEPQWLVFSEVAVDGDDALAGTDANLQAAHVTLEKHLRFFY